MSKTKCVLIFLLAISFQTNVCYENWQIWQPNLQAQNLQNIIPSRGSQSTPNSLQTRSLTGGIATDGNNATTAVVLNLMKVGLLNGFAIRRIKMFNDRIYLARYRRSYWFGTRYYAIDNQYFLETRETCAYRMNETERENLEYEENGEPILDVIYQCQRYAQYCCGLDCCQQINRRGVDKAEKMRPSFNRTFVQKTISTLLFVFTMLSFIIII